jgi:hypothetical protein
LVSWIALRKEASGSIWRIVIQPKVLVAGPVADRRPLDPRHAALLGRVGGAVFGPADHHHVLPVGGGRDVLVVHAVHDPCRGEPFEPAHRQVTQIGRATANGHPAELVRRTISQLLDNTLAMASTSDHVHDDRPAGPQVDRGATDGR